MFRYLWKYRSSGFFSPPLIRFFRSVYLNFSDLNGSSKAKEFISNAWKHATGVVRVVEQRGIRCGRNGIDLIINFSLERCQYLFDYSFLMIFHLFMFSLSLKVWRNSRGNRGTRYNPSCN